MASTDGRRRSEVKHMFRAGMHFPADARLGRDCWRSACWGSRGEQNIHSCGRHGPAIVSHARLAGYHFPHSFHPLLRC